MCVSHGVRVVTVTTRSCAPYIGALLSSVPASVFLFLSLRTKLCRFSPLPLCTSAPLCLCTSAPLRLCSALLSVLLWSQHCSRRSSALVSLRCSSGSALPLRLWFCSATRLGVASSAFAFASAFDSALHSPLLLASGLHLCLLSSRPHSSRGPLQIHYVCSTSM